MPTGVPKIPPIQVLPLPYAAYPQSSNSNLCIQYVKCQTHFMCFLLYLSCNNTYSVQRYRWVSLLTQQTFLPFVKFVASQLESKAIKISGNGFQRWSANPDQLEFKPIGHAAYFEARLSESGLTGIKINYWRIKNHSKPIRPMNLLFQYHLTRSLATFNTTKDTNNLPTTMIFQKLERTFLTWLFLLKILFSKVE